MNHLELGPVSGVLKNLSHLLNLLRIKYVLFLCQPTCSGGIYNKEIKRVSMNRTGKPHDIVIRNAIAHSIVSRFVWLYIAVFS